MRDFYQHISIGQSSRFYWPEQVFTNRCYIPYACRQLAQESTMDQVKTAILQERQQWCFHKQGDKMNYGAHAGCRSRN